jgi:hypothetical protein
VKKNHRESEKKVTRMVHATGLVSSLFGVFSISTAVWLEIVVASGGRGARERTPSHAHRRRLRAHRGPRGALGGLSRYTLATRQPSSMRTSSGSSSLDHSSSLPATRETSPTAVAL